jgi:hypothetical protein
MSHITIYHHHDAVGGRGQRRSRLDIPAGTVRRSCPFQRADIISQVQFAFSHPSIYLKSRFVLLPNLMDALFNYIKTDLILNELINILGRRSLYNTVLLTLFLQVTHQQIVGMYDRLQNKALVQTL